MTMIGRLVHYTVDAVLVSTVLAGVKRSSGFTYVSLSSARSASSKVLCVVVDSPDSAAISDPTLRSIADKFLGVGESIFDVVQATAVNNGYFKRQSRER